jgi:hypothetical protein
MLRAGQGQTAITMVGRASPELVSKLERCAKICSAESAIQVAE